MVVLRARWSRLLVLALVVGAAMAGVASSQLNTEKQSEETYNGAGCYGCHRVWSPIPLRTMYQIIPPETVELAPGQDTEYVVEIKHMWGSTKMPGYPHLPRMEAFIDVSQAPSIAFSGDQPPLLGQTWNGAVPAADPGQLGERFDDTTVTVGAGASDLVITLTPASTDPFTGPDLRMQVYPGKKSAKGTTYESVDDAGPGSAERFVVHGGTNITGLSTGIPEWTIRTFLKPAAGEDSRAVALQQTEIPFIITLDTYYNLTGEPRKYTISERVIEQGQSNLLAWRLVGAGTPGPDEKIRITANVTAFYPHDLCCNDDWGNFTKYYDVAVVAGPGGGAVIQTDASALATVGVQEAFLGMDRISEMVGYLSAFLIIASILSGGMFGTRSRRAFNHLFGTARRRVAFHNALSYFLIVAAIVHTVLFIIEANYYWTLGLIWGGAAILAMAGLAVTGAWQVGMIRTWSYGVWRWTHYGLAIATIALTIVHMLLDGAHFADVQEWVGWENPFPDPSLEPTQ
jgi:hypothetical protein